jgi:hypothetical protein
MTTKTKQKHPHPSLTIKRIAKLAPGRHHDGGQRGLILQVTEGGAKSWLLRFEIGRPWALARTGPA